MTWQIASAQKIKQKNKKGLKQNLLKRFHSFFIIHLLNGLFRLGSKHNYLFQQQGNVYCTASFGSIRRNLLITFLFLLFIIMIF